ncbi:MAG: hypothetical protein WC909_01020 [Candidatus Paceibacterota bacterium]|jgi:hypothetical protein
MNEENTNPWMGENIKKDSFIRKEEPVAPREEPSFFRGGQKLDKSRIIKEIGKNKGWDNFSGHPHKKQMEELNKKLFDGKSYYDKKDIDKMVGSLEKQVPWKSGAEKEAMKDYIKRLKELT